MKALTIIIFLLTISASHAAKLDDVTILDLKHEKDSFELKLQIKNAPKDSYFMVRISPKDERAFDKIALVLMKLNKKDSFKLNLDIKSFSPHPSGSFYRSERVTFFGNALGESLLSH